MPTAVGAGLVQEGGERLGVGDVEGMAGYRSRVAQPGDGGLLEGDVAVADHHPRAAAQQCLGGGEADPAGRPGDGDRLSPNVVHGTKF